MAYHEASVPDLVDALQVVFDKNGEALGHSRETRMHLQVLKILEEGGEAAEAVIGVTGQNPRKGFSHTEDDLLGELFDVALTAMVAAAGLRDNWHLLFEAHVRLKAGRVLDVAGGVDGG